MMDQHLVHFLATMFLIYYLSQMISTNHNITELSRYTNLIFATQSNVHICIFLDQLNKHNCKMNPH